MSVATLERSTAQPPIVSVVTDDGGDIGAQIKARRMAHGMDVKDLAELAGVSRTTLHAIEKGEGARSGTIGKIVAALDRFEQEVTGPYDDAAEKTVTYRVEAGALGVNVTVQGPVESMDELQRSVAKLITEMSKARPSES